MRSCLLSLLVFVSSCDKPPKPKDDDGNPARIARLEKELAEAKAAAKDKNAEKPKPREKEKAKRVPLGKPIASVGVYGIHLAYVASKTKAEEKYKGKVIDLTGPFAGVSKLGERYFVSLAGPGEGLGGATCYIDSTFKDSFAEVKQGASITIRGRVVGPKAGGVFGGTIVLETCEPVE